MNSRAVRAWTRYAVAMALLALVLSPALWLVLMSFRHNSDIMATALAFRTEAMTAPVAIVNFMQYAGFEWGKIAAGGVAVMLPVLVFTVLVRRYLVSGLMAGGVKE